jgi:hypothetical protein
MTTSSSGASPARPAPTPGPCSTFAAPATIVPSGPSSS